jgi:hypothetical protein
MRFRGAVSTGVLILFLAACGSPGAGDDVSVSEFLDDVVTADGAIDSFCLYMTARAETSPALPRVTQCEVQPYEGEDWLIVQFDDPAANASENDLGPASEWFEEPYIAVIDAFAEAEGALDFVDVVVVPTLDRCQTVWEMPVDVVKRAGAGELTIEEVADLSELSGLTYC